MEKNMKTLIIIPAYNEQDNIERVVDNLIENYPQYDYLVVNDGSSDKTAYLCLKNRYNMLDLPVNLGLGGGFQAGMKYALKKEYDAAIQYDGDGQHDARYIEKMLEEMQTTGADIIIGSRFVSEKKPKNLRMLGSNIIQLCIFLTTGKKVVDPTSGMRLFNRRMIKKLANTMNYGPEPDTVAYLIRCGARVKEVQVEMQERIAGESYLNMFRSIQYMMQMIVSILIIQWFRMKGLE
ncbi:MAG: glycosyltransferase family 2 protein [Lachnospiraceae bacterium]|nr:glycosyltransferase family 2 protein [Lachnospiraceae bacterium]